MSLPTVYEVQDREGKVLGCLDGKTWYWEALSREEEREALDAEVGELIVTDLAVYCAGKQKGAATPDFTLASVGAIESGGGRVTAAEFPGCVQAYINESREELKSLKGRERNDGTVKEIFNVLSSIKAARAVRRELRALAAPKVR